ncbi:UPF0462 protein C4orf33 homolog isoform X1 [Camelus dromedarius]|uniref:UPF0462 protein C4orf33 homolog isoform X1 n=1 Tax=Camelus dromedarius TaxID=9838 RepID=UPI001262F7AF|nr:UPF0462 protein C4orf33 homolog isoform X1 [Camelus dromedarius]
MLQPLTEIFKSNQEREQLPTGRGELEYRITTMWDSLPVLQRPMTPKFRSGVQGLLMDLNAPFFDDPPAPHHEAGQPFDGLWKYEGTDSTWSYCSPVVMHLHHRFEYFKPFNLKWIIGDDWEQPDSELWKELCCDPLHSDNMGYNS